MMNIKLDVSISRCKLWRIWLYAMSFGFLLGLMACDDEEGPTSSQMTSPTLGELSSCVQEWEAHYLKRVPTGSTRWLPYFKEQERCPVDLSWVLEQAPQGADLTIYTDAQNRSRFTAMRVGEYIFRAESNGQSLEGSLTVEVIDALDRPFHNYNYYPSSRAALQVGSELWVAGVNTPQIARLDLSTGAAREPLLVGAWPVGLASAESAGLILVTHKAEDSLGLISLESQKLIDSIWVGDEPSEVLWDQERSRAYISLAGAGQVAVVEFPSAEVIATIDAVFDAQAMALSPDGSTLVVASRRSGQSKQFPYPDRDVSEERDLALIDLETLTLSGHILEVASTIHALRFDTQGTLWVSATSNQTEGNLNNPEARSFIHEIFTLELTAGEARRGVEVDLSRQESSGGSTGVTGGFTWCGGKIWVAAEGANAVIELEDSLAERQRLRIEGRPRVVSCAEDQPWVISSNHQQAVKVSEEAQVFTLGLNDQRSEAMIKGFDLFHGQGEGVGDNRSCSACHADGLSDGVVWNAGPVENRQVTRPLRWLEGTELIGWDGYVGSVRISGYVGGSTINSRGTTESSDELGAYLSSLMPAPAANSLTQRDGSLSEEAQRGAELFNGSAGCVGCHLGAVSTNRLVLPEGLTPGKTDIPSLVDVARVGSWYKTGEMPTLEATLDDTVAKFNVSLNDDERTSLKRYLQELTARDFFTLKSDLGPDAQAVATDRPLHLIMSYPVLNQEDNLARLTLQTLQGDLLDLDVRVEGRSLYLTPVEPLNFNTDYLLKIEDNFLSDDGRVHLEEGREINFKTAASPELRMEGEYTFTAQLPFFNPAQGIFDPERELPSVMDIVATSTPSGSRWAIDYGSDMVYTDEVVLSGTELFTKHLPISAGPSFINGHPLNATVVSDDDGDGIIDRIEGTLTMSGPGLEYEGRRFSIELKTENMDCPVGAQGPLALNITEENGEITIDWGTELSLSLFVTSPEATLPLGPVPVMGGETYWSLAPLEFPNGFAGPVRYGSVPEAAMDASETHGAPLGGAELESGKCYKFGVLVNFVYSTQTLMWP